MIDDGSVGPVGCLFGWTEAKGSLRQWLIALGTTAALILALYFAFSAMGL